MLGDRGVLDDLDALGRASGSRISASGRAELGDELQDARSRAATSCSPAVRPSGDVVTRAGVDLLAQAGDRIWKNSSSMLAKIVRKLTRSSSGLRASRASNRTRRGVVQPRQLAVDVRPLRCGAASAAGPGRRGRGGALADGPGVDGGHRVVRAPATIVGETLGAGRSARAAENSTCPRSGNRYGCPDSRVLASLVPLTASATYRRSPVRGST